MTPVDCSPPGSSVHGILQARVPEWVAIVFSRKMTLECKIMKYRHRHYKKDPFLIAQLVKNLPAKRETWVRSESGRPPGEGKGYTLQYSWASVVAQLVKNPPARQETSVRSLGWRTPLEKGKATHSRILAWRIPWPV